MQAKGGVRRSVRDGGRRRKVEQNKEDYNKQSKRNWGGKRNINIMIYFIVMLVLCVETPRGLVGRYQRYIGKVGICFLQHRENLTLSLSSSTSTDVSSRSGCPVFCLPRVFLYAFFHLASPPDP
jgi:hypothetical protein